MHQLEILKKYLPDIQFKNAHTVQQQLKTIANYLQIQIDNETINRFCNQYILSVNDIVELTRYFQYMIRLGHKINTDVIWNIVKDQRFDFSKKKRHINLSCFIQDYNKIFY